MEEIQMIQITKDIEKALAEMSAVELIKLFGKLEEIRFGMQSIIWMRKVKLSQNKEDFSIQLLRRY